MEDAHIATLDLDQDIHLFSIFDGHGGKQVSEYCAERFPVELKKELAKAPLDLCKPLTDIFAKVTKRFFFLSVQIDNELRLLDSDGCGSTACVTVVRKEGVHNMLYVANIGDTRAVLSKNGSAERMSIDDKCDNLDE